MREGADMGLTVVADASFGVNGSLGRLLEGLSINGNLFWYLPSMSDQIVESLNKFVRYPSREEVPLDGFTRYGDEV
jgi:hypothetical protein